MIIFSKLNHRLHGSWAICERGLLGFWQTVQGISEEAASKPEAFFSFLLKDEDDDGPATEKPYELVEGTAHILLEGVIAKGVEPWEKRWLDLTDIDDFRSAIKAADADEEVDDIQITVNSPGGQVTGLIEAMRDLRSVSKPVTAQVDNLMASAAYFIASQCGEIVSTPTAEVGSIGALSGFVDSSKWHNELGRIPIILRNEEGIFKAPNAGGTGLTDEQLEERQEFLDTIYTDLANEMAEKRILSPDVQRGQTLFGTQAFEQGLVDSLVNEITHPF